MLLEFRMEKCICKNKKRVVYDGDKFRSDISSVLAIRFLNYVDLYFDQSMQTVM